jgi:hypothetical protein
MSTVKEIQAAIPNLSCEEIEQIRTWIDDYLEDQLELTDEVKAKQTGHGARSRPANTQCCSGGCVSRKRIRIRLTDS